MEYFAASILALGMIMIGMVLVATFLVKKNHQDSIIPIMIFMGIAFGGLVVEIGAFTHVYASRVDLPLGFGLGVLVAIFSAVAAIALRRIISEGLMSLWGDRTKADFHSLARVWGAIWLGAVIVAVTAGATIPMLY
jgi:hypothetical protein